MFPAGSRAQRNDRRNTGRRCVPGPGVSTGGRHDAQVVLSHPAAERDIERLHKNLPDIAAHPIFEDADEKASELLRAHSARRDREPACR